MSDEPKKESKEHLLTKLLTMRKTLSEHEANEVELLRMREVLRQSEEKYRTTFEYTGTAMMVVEEDTTITMANHKLADVTGFPQEEGQRGHKWLEFVQEQDIPRLMEYHVKRRLDPSSVPSEYEFKLKHRSGELKDILMNVSVVPGTRKTLISLIDITERKRAEQALRESEQRFRELAEFMPGIICEMDLALNITYVNRCGIDMFGYSAGEISAGFNARTVIHPAEIDKLEKDIRNILNGDWGNPGEYTLVRKNGSLIYVIVNTLPIISNSAPTGLRSVMIDISELKQARQRQKLSEERFHGIFQRSPIGIALFATDGSAIDMNAAFTQMFGIDPLEADQAERCRLFTCSCIDEKSLARVMQGQTLRCEVLFDPSAGSRIEPGEKTLSEEVRCFDWCLTPLSGDAGEGVVILAQVQDITERRMAEERELSKARDAADRAVQLAAGLRKEIIKLSSYHGTMISRSPSMKTIFDVLPQMALSDAAALITGESGTGKELVARSLHDLGPRVKKPFVAINCSALPDTLLESELFGYRAGAFTDAKKDKPGRFSQANHGTIFLDEIGDISPAMQAKLLRVLQEKIFEPLGDNRPVCVDVRVIAATNRDLPALIEAGKFREDLYYRIKVLTIKLPPLRERRCDIPLLCDHFIAMFNTRYAKSISAISDDALDMLMGHEFPGNIRELENVLEHAFIFCKGTTIEAGHLPSEINGYIENLDGGLAAVNTIKNFEDLERMFLKNILMQAGGSRTKAAEKLGIHKATLFRKLKILGIE
jgi:PAS domain S-box-containing protein